MEWYTWGKVINSFKKCGISNSLEDDYLWTTTEADDTGDEAADDKPDDAEFDLCDDALEHVSQDIFDMLTVSDEDDFEGF